MLNQPLDRPPIKHIGVEIDDQLWFDDLFTGDDEHGQVELGAFPVDEDGLEAQVVEYRCAVGSLVEVEQYLDQRRAAQVTGVGEFVDEHLEGKVLVGFGIEHDALGAVDELGETGFT